MLEITFRQEIELINETSLFYFEQNSRQFLQTVGFWRDIFLKESDRESVSLKHNFKISKSKQSIKTCYAWLRMKWKTFYNWMNWINSSKLLFSKKCWVAIDGELLLSEFRCIWFFFLKFVILKIVFEDVCGIFSKRSFQLRYVW